MRTRLILALLVCGATPALAKGQLAQAQIFIEFNSTANDLGFHVRADGADWRKLEIFNPRGQNIAVIEGKRGFARGLTELFFEGAEPSLDEVSRQELFADFPEGIYTFRATAVDGELLVGESLLTHDVPDGFAVRSKVGRGEVTISWEPATSPQGIEIVGYQVIAESFQVTLPATARSVELPEEFVASLAPGEHGFEVLAIEVSGNQTISAASFEIPAGVGQVFRPTRVVPAGMLQLLTPQGRLRPQR